MELVSDTARILSGLAFLETTLVQPWYILEYELTPVCKLLDSVGSRDMSTTSGLKLPYLLTFSVLKRLYGGAPKS